MYTCDTICMWRSKNKLWALVLSFHHVKFGDGTQVIRFGNRDTLYLWSILPAQSQIFGYSSKNQSNIERSQMLALNVYPPPLAVRLPDYSFQHSITESIIWCPLGHPTYNKHFTYTFSFMFMQWSHYNRTWSPKSKSGCIRRTQTRRLVLISCSLSPQLWNISCVQSIQQIYPNWQNNAHLSHSINCVSFPRIMPKDNTLLHSLDLKS